MFHTPIVSTLGIADHDHMATAPEARERCMHVTCSQVLVLNPRYIPNPHTRHLSLFGNVMNYPE